MNYDLLLFNNGSKIIIFYFIMHYNYKIIMPADIYVMLPEDALLLSRNMARLR